VFFSSQRQPLQCIKFSRISFDTLKGNFVKESLISNAALEDEAEELIQTPKLKWAVLDDTGDLCLVVWACL
jgi:hypothetical protein